MSPFRFSLIVAGITQPSYDLAIALYEATGGDLEWQMTKDKTSLDFTRAAATLEEAIRGAIGQVEGANLGIRVLRVETADAPLAALINAELLGRG